MKDSETVSLYMDTATKVLSLGAKKGEKTKTITIGNPKVALEKTNLGIAELGEALGFTLADVDKFYCLLGPGSNTGIRMGLTIPRTIYAFNPNIQIYGIPTMDLFTLEGSYAALSDRNGNLFFARKEGEQVSYNRIDKADINTIKEDNIVVEAQDEFATAELSHKNLIKIDVLALMMKYENEFKDYSDKEEEYLPEYILKI